MCHQTNINLFYFYSEEAKLLWKNWVQEDEGAQSKDERFQKEVFLKNLEDEWSRLIKMSDADSLSNCMGNLVI